MDHLRFQCILLQVLSLAGLFNAYLKEPCSDQISAETCWFLRKGGWCTKNPDTLKRVCGRTCGFCGSCDDRYVKEKCEEWKALGACLSRPIQMRKFCPSTCGFCPKNCVDVYFNCKSLSRHRTCSEFSDRMAKYCPATCGYCKPTTPCDNHFCPHGFRCQLKKNREPYCECDIKCPKISLNGPVCAKTGVTYPNMCALKKEECRSLKFISVDYYGKCVNKSVGCQDERRESAAGLCNRWERLGACVRHIGLMEIYCRKTCGFCRVPGNPVKPQCLKTKYGCCWNGKDVTKKGKYGEGCAPCVDRPFCKHFPRYCNSRISKDFMRSNCPLLCGFCVPEKLLRLKEQQKILDETRRVIKLDANTEPNQDQGPTKSL